MSRSLEKVSPCRVSHSSENRLWSDKEKDPPCHGYHRHLPRSILCGLCSSNGREPGRVEGGRWEPSTVSTTSCSSLAYGDSLLRRVADEGEIERRGLTHSAPPMGVQRDGYHRPAKVGLPPATSWLRSCWMELCSRFLPNHPDFRGLSGTIFTPRVPSGVPGAEQDDSTYPAMASCRPLAAKESRGLYPTRSHPPLPLLPPRFGVVSGLTSSSVPRGKVRVVLNLLLLCSRK